MKYLHSSHGTGAAKLLSGDRIAYDRLKDYISGERELPKDVSELMKHHNCYAVYVLEKA